jgi:hypothetical protein
MRFAHCQLWWAILGSNQRPLPCQRTVRKPLTSDFANDLHKRDAVRSSSRPLNAVQRRSERPAAPNLLPHHTADEGRRAPGAGVDKGPCLNWSTGPLDRRTASQSAPRRPSTSPGCDEKRPFAPPTRGDSQPPQRWPGRRNARECAPASTSQDTVVGLPAAMLVYCE